MQATTLRVIRARMAAAPDDTNLGREMVVKGAFGGEIDDPEHAVKIFEQHTQTVIDTIDPDRLLVYQVKQGWQPLCEFLDKPIPEEPFPRVNSRDEFDDIFFGGKNDD